MLITSVKKGEICLIKLLRNQQTLQLSETTANFISEKDCDQLTVCVGVGFECASECVLVRKITLK